MSFDYFISSSNRTGKSRKRNLNIYGVFGDSDVSDEDDHNNDHVNNNSLYSEIWNSKATLSSAKHTGENAPSTFVSAGVFNLSDPDILKEQDKVKTIINDNSSDMDFNSDDDFVDRILSDTFSDDVDDNTKDIKHCAAVLRAKRDLNRMEFKMERQLIDSEKENNFNPHVMEKRYGKGLKMLQKMGYKGGGLGKDGSGTVVPVELKGRTDHRGLHEDTISPTDRLYDKLQHNIKLQRKQILYSNAWRKDTEIINQPGDFVSVINSLNQSDDIDTLIDELDKKCSVLEDSLRHIFYTKQTLEKSIDELNYDISQLQQKIESKTELIKHCDDQLLFIVEEYNSFNDIHDKSSTHIYASTLDKLFSTFINIFNDGTGVFETLALQDLAVDKVGLVLDTIYAEWNVYSEFDRGIDIINNCITFFVKCNSVKILIPNIRNIPLSKLSHFFNNIWNVYDTDFGLKCFEPWNKILVALDESLSAELASSIIARLSEFIVDASNLHLSHIIIHPWLFIFNEAELSHLIDKYIDALKSSLSSGIINDITMLQSVLDNWNVLLDRNHNNTIMTHICATLAYNLNSVEINPTNQDTNVIEGIFEWISIVGYERMADIFSRSFFPRWIKVLSNWIASPNANFEEIIIWYTGWKGVIPRELLKTKEIEKFFREALILMDKASTEPSQNNVQARVPNTNPVKTDNLLSEVESIAEKHGITMMPRVGRLYDGKQMYVFGSATIVLNDVIFLMEKGKLREVTIDQLINIAT